MPKSPETEVLAKFFADIREKRGENLARNFADFRPSISRKIGRKKFHENSSANSTSHDIKFFHREPLRLWEPVGTKLRGWHVTSLIKGVLGGGGKNTLKQVVLDSPPS